MTTARLSLIGLVLTGTACLLAAFFTHSAQLEVIGLLATLVPLFSLLRQPETTHANN